MNDSQKTKSQWRSMTFLRNGKIFLPSPPSSSEDPKSKLIGRLRRNSSRFVEALKVFHVRHSTDNETFVVEPIVATSVLHRPNLRSAVSLDTYKARAKQSVIPTVFGRSLDGGLESPYATEIRHPPSSRTPRDPMTVILEETVTTAPTITTVELASAAKIFFETHYSSILCENLSPRSLRRKQLEAKLLCREMSPEQTALEIQEWARIESEYLRQTRVLKARSNSLRGGISIAGFENIAVLGKGSFGVVRLVKEKDNLLAPITPVETDDENCTRPSGCVLLESTDTNKRGPNATRSMANTSTRTSGAVLRLKNMKKEVYAMKVIRKSDMLRNCQEGHLRAERDFLVASANSRWIVPLIASFQDANHLYLVMDYMVGGDFLGLLIRKCVLSENVARFYIAEMILCVEEAHRLRWIHRDVKPDNFLISASGHLKISDFGLAFDGHWSHDQSYYTHQRSWLMDRLGIKVAGDFVDQEEDTKRELNAYLAKAIAPRQRNSNKLVNRYDGPTDAESLLEARDRLGRRKLAESMVGTSQYMAPEIIRGERQKTKEKILRHKATLRLEPMNSEGHNVSAAAMDLILHLLQDRENRLCSSAYDQNDYTAYYINRPPAHIFKTRADRDAIDFQGFHVFPDDARDIKAHPFFRNLMWDKLHRARPPFVPRVKNWEDTKYFDDDDDEPISDIDSESSSEDGTIKGSYVQIPPSPGDDDDGDDASPLELAMARRERKRLLEMEKARLAACGKVARGDMICKKRPRDRALRDEEVGRRVLQLRKRGAFMGYTWRRPSGWRIDE
ncbi:MAG: hypothetical protein M1834_008322 [Cirrosporium novae-zelandiae]|nr:MAG: hypothetical protein M1834_008322 [Cirrosporium novae-zelandiae]